MRALLISIAIALGLLLVTAIIFGAETEHLFERHESWWSASFPLDAIVFHTDHFKEKYDSMPDNMDRVKYWKSFRDSFIADYGDGDEKQDAVFSFAVHDGKYLAVSFACDSGQAVNVLFPGTLPKPNRLSFMTWTDDDPHIFAPSDPKGAKITFNKSKQKLLYYSFKRKDKGVGWNVVLHTTKALKLSQIRVSEHCKIKDFQSYPHMGGKFETVFEVDAEFASMSIIFPGLKRPIIVIGDRVFDNNKIK